MTTSPEQDARLDKLNDQGFSFTDAANILDLTLPSTESVSAAAMQASRARETDLDYYSGEFRLTGPINLSEEQIAKNALHFEAIRQANQRRSSGK